MNTKMDMMGEYSDNILLNRVLGGEIAPDDPIFLYWLDESELHQKMYEKELKEMVAEAEAMHKLDTKQLWSKINKEIAEEEKRLYRRRISFWMYRTVAIFIVLLSVAYLLLQGESDPVSSMMSLANKMQTIQNHEPVLLLSDGQTISLDSMKKLVEANGVLVKIDSVGKLQYVQDGKHKKSKILYNTIQVPHNRELQVTLSDGTIVYLAAQTTFKYPVNFEGKERDVYVKGEAFFQVAPDREKTFVVYGGEFSVKALGTSFNVMNYDDERSYQATLCSGKVEVTVGKQHEILEPGQQAVIYQNDMKVREVNTLPYTSWMKDRFYFINEELQVIMRKIARWYGVKIYFEDEGLKTYHFTGNLPKYEDINKMFELLKLTTSFQYTIDGNVVKIHR